MAAAKKFSRIVLLIILISTVFIGCSQSATINIAKVSPTATASVLPTSTSPATISMQSCSAPMNNPPKFDFPLPPNTIIKGHLGASEEEVNLACTYNLTEAQIIAFMTAHLPAAGYHIIGQSPNDTHAPVCQNIDWVKNDESSSVAWDFTFGLSNWYLITCSVHYS